MQKIKSLIKKIMPISLYIYLCQMRKMKKVNRISKKSNIDILDINELKKIKKSDTLFILGSGDSINSITEEEWKIIKSKDSIGLNFWLYHKFIPNFYCYEEGDDDERNNIFYKNLKLKEEEYKSVIFLVKSIQWHGLDYSSIPKKLIKNHKISTEIEAFSSSRKEMIKFYNKLKIRHTKTLVQARASISYLIYLGYLLGYKEIVLCGVDLNNTKYFFEDIKYNKYIIPKNEMKDIHFTEMKRVDKLTISEIIEVLAKDIFKNEIKIYIAKSVGVLSSKIEVYKF